MPRNKIQDLQNHLFAQIEALVEAKGQGLETEINRSKAIQGVASTLISSAKVQIDFLNAVKGERDIVVPILESNNKLEIG